LSFIFKSCQVAISAGVPNRLIDPFLPNRFQFPTNETSYHITSYKVRLRFVCLFDFGATAPVGQGLLILKVSRSHTTTHHSR